MRHATTVSEHTRAQSTLSPHPLRGPPIACPPANTSRPLASVHTNRFWWVAAVVAGWEAAAGAATEAAAVAHWPHWRWRRRPCWLPTGHRCWLAV